MYRKLLFGLFISSCLLLEGQQVVFESNIVLNSVFTENIQTYPVTNQVSGDVVLFMMDQTAINAIHFNSKWLPTDTGKVERPHRKYKKILGHSVIDQNYMLFFTTKKNNIYLVKSFDIETGLVNEKLLNLNLKNELLLDGVSYNNDFYLLTVLKNSSIIIIRVFRGEEVIETARIDCSQYKFSRGNFYRLSDVLRDNLNPFTLELKIPTIDIYNHNALDITSKKNKLFCYNDKIFITLDNEISGTKLISIDLNDFSHKVDIFSRGAVETNEYIVVKTGSYLFENRLFQITTTIHEILLRVINIENGNILNEFRAKDDEEVSFSNTAFIQEGGVTLFPRVKEKDIGNIKQAFRKISSGEPGISVYRRHGNLEIMLGGIKMVTYSGGGGMSSYSTSLSGTGNYPSTYQVNSSISNYNMYTNTRSVYFKTVLDDMDLRYVDCEVQKNAYDKIKDFSNTEHSYRLETIIPYKNYFILGYYNPIEKKYYMRKFTD